MSMRYNKISKINLYSTSLNLLTMALLTGYKLKI